MAILTVVIITYVRRGLFFSERKNTVPGILHNSQQRRAIKPGPADLLKTISIGFIADGLIFKGLIGLFVTGYSDIALEE